MNDRVLRGEFEQLNVNQAEKFFKSHIYDLMQDTKADREAYEFFETGAWIAPRLWELFVAILIGQKKAKASFGHDLAASEVKTTRTTGKSDDEAFRRGLIDSKPKSGSGWEYQYHRNAGENKLSGEVKIDHVLIRYSADLDLVEVYAVRGISLLAIFDSWSAGLKANYSDSAKQRYRRSIGVNIVKKPEVATKLLVIKNGRVTFSDQRRLGELFPSAYRAQ